MPPSPEREYLRRRAGQELGMTLHADCLPAERAHNLLVGFYLKACVECLREESAECLDCVLGTVCGQGEYPTPNTPFAASVIALRQWLRHPLSRIDISGVSAAIGPRLKQPKPLGARRSASTCSAPPSKVKT